MPDKSNWIPAFIGVGSNLDDPVAQIQTALGALAKLPASRVQLSSGLYRNPPMGPADQPDFVNAVVAILTRLSPHELLRNLQAIESRQGRDRGAQIRWGPRRIDLDVLTYGSRIIDEENLSIPHSGISDRNFVLLPMLEIAPELVVPGHGTVRSLSANLDNSKLVRIADC